jgi:hypothetical protein
MSTARTKAKDLLRAARSKANLNQTEEKSQTTINNNNLIVSESQIIEEKIANNFTELNLSESTENTSSQEKNLDKEVKEVKGIKETENSSHFNTNVNNMHFLKPNKDIMASQNLKTQNFNKGNLLIKPKEPTKLILTSSLESQPIKLETHAPTMPPQNLIKPSESGIPVIQDKEKLMKRLTSAKQMSQKKMSKHKEMMTRKSDKVMAMAQLMNQKQTNSELADYEEQMDKILDSWDNKENPSKKKYLLEEDADIQKVEEEEEKFNCNQEV